MKKKLIFAATTASAAVAAYSHQAEAAEHTVQPGESLWLIANKYNTSIDQLKSLNQLSSNLIFPYQTLKVSGEVTTPRRTSTTTVRRPMTNANSGSVHTVQAGESLYLIASKYNTSISKIMKLNNLSSYLIFPNQKLRVSGNTYSAPSTPVRSTVNTTPARTSTNGTKTHIVQPGDYLYKIAVKYGITIQNIKDWNNLSSNVIYSNQRLIVSQAARQVTTQPTSSYRAPVKVVNTPVATPVVTTPVFSHQNLYDYGQCTWYVFNKRAAIGKGISTYWWHAYNWANGARKDGYTVNRTPSVGAIATTTDGYYGHVAFVERVNADGTILVSETNYLTPSGVVGYRTLSLAQMSRYQFIH
ncbi:LysM peptidoglycan-binding domain-containing protein [Macrococcoides caseolyticum]|uniref:LysM peptidoglycan-binding domain-containing protein n=1 Tax=Macrococcoides caseolyticum TaxID=69966 RepID=UPI001F1BF5A2|nr:LysM peptidoglycan-binding domain-containing protein [Macrococcus caseolyticus]MCE4957787.1 LysM peptidoglycan-binding domain-containing protein [Macrococcus caseolyticus]